MPVRYGAFGMIKNSPINFFPSRLYLGRNVEGRNDKLLINLTYPNFTFPLVRARTDTLSAFNKTCLLKKIAYQIFIHRE